MASHTILFTAHEDDTYTAQVGSNPPEPCTKEEYEAAKAVAEQQQRPDPQRTGPPTRDPRIAEPQ